MKLTITIDQTQEVFDLDDGIHYSSGASSELEYQYQVSFVGASSREASKFLGELPLVNVPNSDDEYHF